MRTKDLIRSLKQRTWVWTKAVDRNKRYKILLTDTYRKDGEHTRTYSGYQWLYPTWAGTELLPQLPVDFICSHRPQPWPFPFSIHSSYCTDSSLTCVLPSSCAVVLETRASLKTDSSSPNSNESSPLIATLNMSSLFRAETAHWAVWITDAFHCEELWALRYRQHWDDGCLNAFPSLSAVILNVHPQPPHHVHCPRPSVPHLHGSGAPPGMVTPPPPCAAVPLQHHSLEKKLFLLSNLNFHWWNPWPPLLIYKVSLHFMCCSLLKWWLNSTLNIWRSAEVYIHAIQSHNFQIGKETVLLKPAKNTQNLFKCFQKQWRFSS